MAVSPIPAGAHTLNTYLIVRDLDAVIAFCTATFDAREVSRTTWQGRTSHVSLEIGDSLLMAGQSDDEAWIKPAMLYVYVDDCDDTYARALAAGAEQIMPPMDMFYGDRHGGVRDAAGNTWWIATHVEDVAPDELQRRHEAEMRRREGVR
jgi:uncharacterized glyoxalase superfamily protein PhnB